MINRLQEQPCLTLPGTQNACKKGEIQNVQTGFTHLECPSLAFPSAGDNCTPRARRRPNSALLTLLGDSLIYGPPTGLFGPTHCQCHSSTADMICVETTLLALALRS